MTAFLAISSEITLLVHLTVTGTLHSRNNQTGGATERRKLPYLTLAESHQQNISKKNPTSHNMNSTPWAIVTHSVYKDNRKIEKKYHQGKILVPIGTVKVFEKKI